MEVCGGSCHDARVGRLIFDEQLGAGDARVIAELHREWAIADGYDQHSIDSQLPTVDDLAAELSAADGLVVARDDARIRSYGHIISWTEADGTRVHLLDTHSAPGSDRAAVDEGLLLQLEDRAKARSSSPAVLGANAEVADLDRTAVLDKLGYTLHFEVVELELRERLKRGPMPPGIAIRAAQPSDVAAIVELTKANWEGRAYFGGLSLDKTEAWLTKIDPELFLLAEADGELVGLAVAHITDRVVEIEDLGVRPTWRRRGLATGLMTELLDRIAARTQHQVRLVTEGHDPSGARTLYESLGFTTAARHGRYRKPLIMNG